MQHNVSYLCTLTEVNYGRPKSLQKEQPLQDKWEWTSLPGGRKSDYSKSFLTGLENFSSPAEHHLNTETAYIRNLGLDEPSVI